MKIVLLSPLPPPSGGIARWTERFLELCKGKLEVSVVNTALVGARSGEAGIKTSLKDEIKRAKGIIRQTKTELKKSPNIMHLNTSCSRVGIFRDFLCVRIAVEHKIPVITHCHCNIQDQLGNGHIQKVLFTYIVKHSAKVFTLNSTSEDFVNQIIPGRTELCPNFISNDLIVDKHTINSEIKQIIYVGDVRISKGSDEVYKVANDFPGIQFVMVGSVTEEMKQFEKPANVVLLGRLNAAEVLKKMDEADVFLFPSLSEGFSNALLEAMARGLPIIATDVGANRDMIEAKGGIIVPIHSTCGIKEAIQKMSSEKVRQSMSCWNIKKTEDYYESQQVMSQMLNAYNLAI